MKKHMLEWFLCFYLNKEDEKFDFDKVLNYLQNYKQKKRMTVIPRYRCEGFDDDAPCCQEMEKYGDCPGHPF